QHLEQGHDIERVVRKGERRRVAAHGRKRWHAAITHSLKISNAVVEQVQCRDTEGGEGVEQGPEEGATSAADIDQAGGVDAAQDAQHSADAGQLHGTLEAVEAETSLDPCPDDGVEVGLAERVERAGEERVVRAGAQPATNIGRSRLPEVEVITTHRVRSLHR